MPPTVLSTRDPSSRDVDDAEADEGEGSEVKVTAEIGTPIALPETFLNIPVTSLLSTVSDLTPTGLGEESSAARGRRLSAVISTFHFEDGNMEVVCGDTAFWVCSTIIALSSKRLRDMLSPTTLLNAPMPEGYPRVIFAESAKDFVVLFNMICTSGYLPFPSTQTL